MVMTQNEEGGTLEKNSFAAKRKITQCLKSILDEFMIWDKELHNL